MKKFMSGCCIGFCLTAEGMLSPFDPNRNSTDAMLLLGEQQQFWNDELVQRETTGDGTDLSFSSDAPEDKIQENINDDESPDLMSSTALTSSEVQRQASLADQNQVQRYTNPVVVLNVFDRDLKWSNDILKNNQREDGQTVIPEEVLRYKYENSTPFQKMFMYNFNWTEYKKRSEEEKGSRWKIAEATKSLCRLVGIMESRHSALFSEDVFVSLFNFGFKSLEAPEKVRIFEGGEEKATKVYQDLEFAERYWFEAIWIVFRWAELKSVETKGHFSFCMEENERRDYTTDELSNWEKNLFRSFKDSKVFIFAKNEVMNREAALVSPNLLLNMTGQIDQLTQAVCQVEIARREDKQQLIETQQQLDNAKVQYNKDRLALTNEIKKQKQNQKKLQKQLEQQDITFRQQLEAVKKQNEEIKEALEISKKVSEENEALHRRLEQLEKLPKEQQSQRSSQKQDAQLLEENFSEKQENTRESPQEKVKKPVETRIENPASVLEDFDFEQSFDSEQGELKLGRLRYTGGVKDGKPAGLGRAGYGAFAFEAVFKEWHCILSKGWKVYSSGSVLTGGRPSEQQNWLDMERLSGCLSTNKPSSSSCVYKTREGSWVFSLGKIELQKQNGETETIVDLKAQ